jgi:hypothetical protein
MQAQDLVSNLKMRVSYGLTGNQEIGAYQSLAQLGATEYVLGRSTVITGYTPTRIANPDLQWESSRQLDVGLDIGLWDQRLRLTADYYRKITDDLLLPVTLPTETGFDSAVQNAGSMRNTGIEFSVGADLLTGAFSWSTNANASANRNEVADLGPSGRFFGLGTSAKGVGSPGGLVEEGRPIGVYYGYETDGIFNDQAEIDAHGVQPEAQPGGIRFVDTNSDGQITPEDRTVIGNPHANFTYGWANDLSYRGFELSVLLQGVYGADVLHPALARLEGMTGFDLQNNSTVRRFKGRWTPENRDAEFPRAGYSPLEGRQVNERIVEDGSYLRLKNITLSYNLPVSRVGISSVVRRARLYVKGHNLVTFTDYTGYNPDVNNNGQGTINQNIDISSYPLAREYIVGIELGF